VKDIEAEHPERKGRIIINKATGIGCTEWFLRYIIYKAITDRHWRNSRVCIVTGPRLDLAVRLIQRIKNLFQLSNAIPEQYGDGSNPRFDSRETVVYIGSTKIEAFPSNNQQSLRGLTNIKLDGRRARPTFHVGISSARPAQ
jgi:late competence protein required for DNA uptake (superfamily II DNA/RNA helicase)